VWGWLKSAFAFVNKIVGKVLSPRAEESVMTHGLDVSDALAKTATDSLLNNQISASQWESQMRLTLKNNYIQQYLLGIGGKGNMTQADYGSIGGMLAEQYKYLRNFAQQIANGQLSEAEIQRRVEMYINSAREAWNRARARIHGIPDGSLPDYPGSGHTECLTNCKCAWEIEESDTEWRAFWRLGYVRTEHCTDCVHRSQEWSPYIIPKEFE
jgi:hypothetical protein